MLLVRPVVAALAGVPGALDAWWGATDLTPQMVSDDDARITAAQFCIAWAELIRLTRNPQIALAIASATPPGAFGIVEYVCRSAPTLGDALRQWVRYLNLLDDAVVVGLATEGDRALLRVVRESEAPAPASHELCFALLAQQARQLSTVPFRITTVEFTHRAPGDPAVYRKWFDAPVTFGAATTQLVMPLAALDASLASSDPKLLAILTRAAEELHRRAPADPTITSQVARLLREALRTDEAHIERVAKQLGLTARSLQRRLKDEATSFQDVREQVRRELAQRYLEDNLSISEISFLLGFSEPSAFFRAFKRWTGQTPVEARRRAVPA
ncbi:MAG: Transcriptional regulator, AraC family protein [Myxococcales bacterium]|nr:Transcriptional regulator, AraC family protein [Myxococcales bacterium]